jgi:hypothetical protein
MNKRVVILAFRLKKRKATIMEYREIYETSQVLIKFLPEIRSRKHNPVDIIAGILYVLVTGIQ